MKHMKQGCLKFKDKTLRKLQWLVVGRYMRPMKVQFVQFTVQIFSRPESMYFVSCCGYFFLKGWHYVAGRGTLIWMTVGPRVARRMEHWWQTRQEDGVEQNAT